ncbi:site-specific DNA-methyltransferase [Rhodobacteraceae bacterium KMS-5]|uniref:site-specific DNA-methyltransferase (adenine-specific) n=2 Tax=Tabrizicola oligotrophica TaxID=2710650 RepID=A0A6M0QVQ5_9RHOB|nr:site-specific DNA-methyltransferase [Tabrizicola oligotrophica]
MITQSIELRPIEALIPYQGNARTHSRAQIKQIAASITAFGFVNPILVDAQDQVIAGHGRLAAAKHLGLTEVPVLSVTHLSAAEKRAYILADNRLAEKAGWDRDILAIELQALVEFDFEVELTGFAIAEIDVILDDARERGGGATGDAADDVPALPAGPAITKLGDLWQLGPHRLICGDARDANALGVLLGNQPVDLIFTDPPYNVAIEGHVSGLGRVKHREFAMASGEMTEVEFIDFLTAALVPAAALCRDGAIAFVCMDWRHMREMMAAGDTVFAELKNLCVWNKTNGGMGTFYRSKHELVFVWKVKPGPHVNSFGLGETGRYRTNVWDYAGVNTFGATRDADLAMHPTVKPVTLIGDAIRDCARRGDVVLDMFGGSGSTLIAADLAGRQARLVEYDPLYCDTIIRRWEKLSGKRAKHLASGL